MVTRSQPRYFVYVASAGDNEILVLGMDSATEPAAILQRLDLKKHAAAGGVSTPMALGQGRRFLYVALRTPLLPIVAFSVDPREGTLAELGSARVPASTPYILTDRTGRFLFSVANPGATLAVSRIDEAGRPADRAHQVLHTGHKLHCVAIDESNRFVYVSSTDDGVIHRFRFDAVTGLLEPGDPPSVALEDGGDPRHMAFSPDGRFLYVTTEAGGRVARFAVDRATGGLSEQPGADMMPAAFSGHPKTADIHITPDGRYLYATERALSRIVGYRVDAASGALTPIGDTPTEPVPRAFAIAPDGGFLLVAGEASGKLRAYAIDPATGVLATGVEIAMGARPNWIEFVEPARPTTD